MDFSSLEKQKYFTGPGTLWIEVKVRNPPYSHILLFSSIHVIKLPSFAFLNCYRYLQGYLFPSDLLIGPPVIIRLLCDWEVPSDPVPLDLFFFPFFLLVSRRLHPLSSFSSYLLHCPQMVYFSCSCASTCHPLTAYFQSHICSHFSLLSLDPSILLTTSKSLGGISNSAYSKHNLLFSSQNQLLIHPIFVKGIITKDRDPGVVEVHWVLRKQTLSWRFVCTEVETGTQSVCRSCLLLFTPHLKKVKVKNQYILCDTYSC